MIRFTTRPITVRVKNADLRNSNVYVTIAQQVGHSKNKHVVTFGGSRVALTYADSNTTLVVQPTQAESGGFKAGKADVIVNWVMSGSGRDATLIAEMPVYDNLMEEEVTYAS